METDQILALWRIGLSCRRIALDLRVDRDTVRSYLKAAGIELKRGRPKSAIGHREVPTDFSSKPAISSPSCPPTTPSLCEPHRSFIEESLSRGMLAKSIWQDLKDEQDFAGSYDSLKRFVRKLKNKSPQSYCVIPTHPGREAQVDYGRGALTKDPVTGKYKRPWLFSLKLSHSRKAFRKTLWKSSSKAWCELHEEAFRFLGGVPETLRLDNLKEGVIRPDLYEPELNPLYAQFLKHYGVIALPCRVATPRHKGKVESDIKYAQNALKGRSFESIEEQNTYLAHWNERWADTRIHGTIKRQVREVFESEERKALKALPSEHFPLMAILTRKVHPDCHLLVDGAFYSAPHAYVGQELTVHVSRLFVDLIHPHTGERLIRHRVVEAGRHQTQNEHYPEAKQTHKLHERFLERAKHIGAATQTLIAHLLALEPYLALRRCQGILALARKYPKEQLEKAASVCLEKQIPSYRAFKNLLGHQKPQTQTATLFTQQHPLIRPVSLYQELWDHQQKGEVI